MDRYAKSLKIGGANVEKGASTYFIADIAANHDGELSRAIDLIHLAKEAGADVAKFQHFKADKIVSDVGFSGDFAKLSHQAGWDRSVYEVYDAYHTRREWTQTLVEECRKADIEFMTTPYDVEAIDSLSKDLNAFKVGSGDITFEKILSQMAGEGKPVLLATGASNLADVIRAVDTILALNPQVGLLQCNTNYTGSLENFGNVNLNVLNTFASIWPGMPLGLSDHTPGHSAVLGAVAMGACFIEKHFTDDNSRIGPDHDFALNPSSWRAMVDATRELELALGDGVKRVESNELEAIVIQRRSLCAATNIPAGKIISVDDLEELRPCPAGAYEPYRVGEVVGKATSRDIQAGSPVLESWLKDS